MTSQKTLLVGRKPVLEAILNQKKIDKILISPQAEGEGIKEIYQRAKENNILIQRVPIDKINKITNANHQGVIAFLALVPYYDLQSVIDLANDKGQVPLFLLLDGITDVKNIGGIIRTAYSYGVHAIVIPENGVAPLREDAMKTSAGALNNMTVCRVKYLQEAIDVLRLNGIKVIGTDLKATTFVADADLTTPCAIVVGNEDDGVHHNILKQCDESIKIPLHTSFDSLNVSVATGIVLYGVFLQRHKK